MAKKKKKPATKKAAGKKATKKTVKKATKKAKSKPTTKKSVKAKKATKKVAAKPAAKKVAKVAAKKVAKKPVAKKVETKAKSGNQKPRVPSLEEIAKDNKVTIPTTNPFAADTVKSGSSFSHELDEDEELQAGDEGFESAKDAESDDFESLEDDVVDEDEDEDEGGKGYF